jgi:hypothetical protein
MINRIIVYASVSKEALHFKTAGWAITTPLVRPGTYGFIYVDDKVTGHFSYIRNDFYGKPPISNAHLQRMRAIVVETSLDWLRQNYLRFTCTRQARNDYPRPVSAY